MPREPRDLRGWIKAAEKDLSKAIRMERSDPYGVCQCVTCPVRRFWSDGIQAGHFLPKSDSIRFSEIGIHPQCKTCNCTGNSYAAAYSRHKIEDVAQAYLTYMLDTHGRYAVEALKVLKLEPKTWTWKELIVMRIWYKGRFKVAKEARGI